MLSAPLQELQRRWPGHQPPTKILAKEHRQPKKCVPFSTLRAETARMGA